MCSKHVDAWNKLIIKFSASRCTVSKMLKFVVDWSLELGDHKIIISKVYILSGCGTVGTFCLHKHGSYVRREIQQALFLHWKSVMLTNFRFISLTVTPCLSPVSGSQYKRRRSLEQRPDNYESRCVIREGGGTEETYCTKKRALTWTERQGVLPLREVLSKTFSKKSSV